MKTIILSAILLFTISAEYTSAQKKNLDKLPEKERKEYLLKKAKETIMEYGPDWYRDYKEPVIRLIVIDLGPDKGRSFYSVGYLYDPNKEQMEYSEYSVGVGIYADTGEVRGISFGDGISYNLSSETKTRNGGKEKLPVRPCPSPKPN